MRREMLKSIKEDGKTWKLSKVHIVKWMKKRGVWAVFEDGQFIYASNNTFKMLKKIEELGEEEYLYV